MEREDPDCLRDLNAIMEGLFSDPLSTDKIQRSKNVIQGTVDLILSSGPEATHHLMSITAHDYYTLFSFGQCHYFRSGGGRACVRQDPSTIFTGWDTVFLLHDLGKSLIDVEIINKPGKLNEQEWA